MKPPFSMSYVLAETYRHLHRSIDISVQKTLSRLADFEDEPEKVKEIMLTLTNLNRLSKVLATIKSNNQDLFGEK